MRAEFPIDGGDAGALMRRMDWSASPVGPPETWSGSLKTTVGLILAAKAEIVLFWGPQFVALYNDAYAPTIGAKHPRAMGRPAVESWTELWDDLGPLLQGVLDTGETISAKDRPFQIERFGYLEEVYFDISFSPVREVDGSVGGVLCIVSETTERVLAQRELAAQKAAIEGAARRLSVESAFLQQLFEETPSFMAMLTGANHRFRLANAVFRELIGGRNPVGQPLVQAVPEIEGQGFVELLDQVRNSGRAKKLHGARAQLQRGGQLETRILDLIYQPVTSADGKVTGVFVEGQDVTERAHAETALRESEGHLRALVNASSDMLYRMSADWRELRQLDGRGILADIDGPSIAWVEDYLLPEDLPEIHAAIREAIREKKPFQLEHRVRLASGSVGWTFSRAVPLLDDAGEVVEWFGAASDVTARREAEEHLRLVINELNHRVKNTLAMMQAMAIQTFRTATDLEQAQTDISGRIMALSRANDLLTGERYVGAALGDVVEQTVGGYCDGNERCRVDGPHIELSAKTALAMSMALHELATNAMKYGAWSTADGVVEISWRRSLTPDGERLHMEWREHGGPPVVMPTRRGFGSRLIERGLSAEMGGEVRLHFEPRGVVCTIDAPLVPDEEG